MNLHRLERAFERIVEGAVAGAFRLRVQPAEIGRQLERAMLHGRTNSVGRTLAPHAYVVTLNPDDAAEFAGWEEALCREMEGWLAEVAHGRGLATLGPIRVRFAVDPAVARRSVRAEGSFHEDHLPPMVSATVRVLLLEALDPGVSDIVLDAGIVTVGRSGDNDVVLTAPEISRFHARIEAAGAGWRVVDLGSTNGTWVNGRRIHESPLNPGDELAFDGVRFTVTHG